MHAKIFQDALTFGGSLFFIVITTITLNYLESRKK